MIKQYRHTYPYPLATGYHSPYTMGQDIDQETIIKWVVVPGITVAALTVAARLFRRRRRRRRR